LKIVNMTQTDHLSILIDNVKALEESLKWLSRSFTICNDQHNLQDISEEGMDAFESFTSRFSRTSDLLFNKVFRSIAYLEEGEQMSWLDVIFLMEKINVIDSAEDARLIKELRNDIVHEYVLKDLIPLFDEVLKKCPLLLQYSENAIKKAEEVITKIKKF